MKENGYMKRPQSLERLENIAKVLEYHNTHKKATIKEIAKALDMSESSVQRYLHASGDPEVEELIREYLKNNKKEGNRRGGQTSQQKYGYGKDETGHFTGRKR